MVEGCALHAIDASSVASRWSTVKALIDATPEGDHNAQWSVILYCVCCLGPAKLPHELCSRCEGAK